MTNFPASKIEIHLLTNFTNNLLVTGVQQKLKTEGMIAEVIPSNFDQITQHLASLPKKSKSARHIFIITRAENMDEQFAVKNSPQSREVLQNRYREFLEAVEILTSEIEANIYLSNLFELSESNIFDAIDPQQIESKRDITLRMLQATLTNNKNLNFFNVQSVINLLGLEACWNKNQDLLFRQPLTLKLASRLGDAIVERIKESQFTGIKVIATDGDGTLWGGVIGEDSASEIEIGHDFPGSVFYKYQRFLLDKKLEGILLVLVSKNNPSDIYNFFETREDMPIKIDDFAMIEASWGTKSSALERIAKTINIGLDSILFVDDSTFEILEVTNEIPQIKSLLLDPKVENRTEQISSLGMKWASGSTVEDVNRTEMIKQNIQREAVITHHASKDILESLKLNLEIATIADESDQRLTRIHQLINKTNQFNMTCERLSLTELIEFLKTGKVYSGSLSDKFGDYGLIAVVLVDFPDRSTAHFVNFLVSCRALGRKVEEVLISELVRDFHNRGITKIIASWKENPKNAQTKDFYSKLGFRSQIDLHSLSEIQFKLETVTFKAEKPQINVTNFIS